MKPLLLITWPIMFLALGTCNEESAKPQVGMEVGDCIRGTIVGERCGVVALQLSSNLFGAQTWVWSESNGPKYENVVGLKNLRTDLYQVNNRIYVVFREPTTEESVVPCYLNLPPPPGPLYVVVSASESGCEDLD